MLSAASIPFLLLLSISIFHFSLIATWRGRGAAEMHLLEPVETLALCASSDRALARTQSSRRAHEQMIRDVLNNFVHPAS